jgi:hypothetical protein
MAAEELLDRGYATIMEQIVATTSVPHFTELAAELELDLAEAKQLVHELVAITPGWTHPGTDHIASFPPFNLQPTQYRVSIDGVAGWYAQCGLEATAIRWLVPGRVVRVDAPCLCCGEPISLEMTDEELAADPVETVGYTSAPIGGDAASRPYR